MAFLIQVMFRAGRLAALEEIREEALTVIVIKMQSHIRRVLVAQTFKERQQQKYAKDITLNPALTDFKWLINLFDYWRNSVITNIGNKKNLLKELCICIIGEIR